MCRILPFPGKSCPIMYQWLCYEASYMMLHSTYPPFRLLPRMEVKVCLKVGVKQKKYLDWHCTIFLHSTGMALHCGCPPGQLTWWDPDLVWECCLIPSNWQPCSLGLQKGVQWWLKMDDTWSWSSALSSFGVTHEMGAHWTRNFLDVVVYSSYWNLSQDH